VISVLLPTSIAHSSVEYWRVTGSRLVNEGPRGSKNEMLGRTLLGHAAQVEVAFKTLAVRDASSLCCSQVRSSRPRLLGHIRSAIMRTTRLSATLWHWCLHRPSILRFLRSTYRAASPEKITRLQFKG
jgi:hypothetical protein